MVDHCANCNCENGKKYCGLKKETFIKIVMLFSVICFIGMSFIVFSTIARECTSRWTQTEYFIFEFIYGCFIIMYMLVLDATIEPLEYMRIFIVWLCTHMRGCTHNIWNRLGLPTMSDTRLMFSMRRARARTHPQHEISVSDNESNEERPPPLPPRNRQVVEGDEATLFQKLTSKVSQGASSSTTPDDESADVSSSLFQRPHCSKQSAPSLESSGRRGKKLSKRERFKKMMSKATNLNAIHEEGLDTQGTSGVQVPFSSLAQNSASVSETERETSFITEPHQSGAEEQEFGYANIDNSDEPAPTQRAYGEQVQEKTSSTGDKKDSEQTSVSIIRTKKQSSTVQDSSRQSSEQPSTSGFPPDLKWWNPTSSASKLALINAPVSKFGTRFRFDHVPISTLENPAQEQTFADVHSGSQGEVNVSGIQCQSSASYIRPSESESQPRAFDTEGTEGNQRSRQPPASINIQNPQTLEQSSAVASSSSQEQSRLSDIQKSQRNRDQAAASYVKLPELEKLLRESDVRTDMNQSSPEQSTIRHVQTSPQDPVSSTTGIQRMPSHQGQTSTDPQRHGRKSDVQKRRSSRKHNPIPNYMKSSDSESESQEERLNLQQQTQSYIPFPLAMNQLQTSGIGGVHEHSSQGRGLQERTLREETSAPSTSRSSNTMEKLRNLQQASAAGFPRATSQTRNIGRGHELPLSADYGRAQFRGKAEKATSQKRRESLSIVSERPIRESSFRTERTERPTESTSQLSVCGKVGMETSSIQSQQIQASGGGYLPHSVLIRSGDTPTQAHVATTSLHERKEADDRIRQRSSGGPLHLYETEKQETLKKETILTLDRATGGVVLCRDGAEVEGAADSIEPSFMCDQQMGPLDLSHIKVPLPPKDINPSIDEGQNQSSERLIRESSTRTRRAESSAESTSQSSACARGRLETSSFQNQQIEASPRGYLPHSTVSISGGTTTQSHVAITPLNIRKEVEDRNRQRSSRDPSHLQETDKEETQRKETILSLHLATGGIVLCRDGAEGEADSIEPSFLCDQQMGNLDLSDIKVPFPSSNDENAPKDEDERQN